MTGLCSVSAGNNDEIKYGISTWGELTSQITILKRDVGTFCKINIWINCTGTSLKRKRHKKSMAFYHDKANVTPTLRGAIQHDLRGCRSKFRLIIFTGFIFYTARTSFWKTVAFSRGSQKYNTSLLWPKATPHAITRRTFIVTLSL